MAAISSRRRPRPPHQVHKPHGVIHPRVERVGTNHFGIVSVDVAKARSKWMLTDFFGNVLIGPTPVEHNRAGLDAAVLALSQACTQHELLDVIVAIERTGRYHLPVKRVFQAAGYETRIVHPYATKQYRQPANPGNKTDDTDLSAIFRAAAAGFSLSEPATDPLYRQLQLLARHRRDLVRKAGALRCQIREHIQVILPGFGDSFSDLFDCKYAIAIATSFPSPGAIQNAGLSGLRQLLRTLDLKGQTPALEKIVAWAHSAAAGAEDGAIHSRIIAELDIDRRSKEEAILVLERELAALLVRTPYVLLLGAPGINIVSAAEFAGEAGRIELYRSSRAITGRAGLYASRYQSDLVDCCNGPLIRCANRQLRQAILMIADNLIACNDHFRGAAQRWRQQRKDARDIHVKVGCRFCRIAYQIVAGRNVYRHPCCQHRHYLLKKLLDFDTEHGTDAKQTMSNLKAAVDQLPRPEWAAEAIPLADELSRVQRLRGRGPQPLGMILPAILARLGVSIVESEPSGETDPT
jgi:transposase